MAGSRDAETAVPGNVVFDLDGVVYLAGQGVPGAGETLGELNRRGYRIVFATNNSTTERVEVAAHIEHLTGFPADPAQIVTSGMAAATMLRPGESPAFVVGEPGLVATLRAAGIAVTTDPGAARSVFVGLDRQVTYDRLRDAATAVLGGARFISTNSDLTFPTPRGLWPGGGTLTRAIALTSGVEPEVAGKPNLPMRDAVAPLLGPGPTWMIGDRGDTDVAFGRASGWNTILVLSGVTATEADISDRHRPDLVLGSIADLAAALP